MSDSVNLSFDNEKDDKENRIEKLVNKNTGDNRLKNLYENVGTRVSKLREINENYELKIKEQETDVAYRLSATSEDMKTFVLRGAEGDKSIYAVLHDGKFREYGDEEQSDHCPNRMGPADGRERADLR